MDDADRSQGLTEGEARVAIGKSVRAVSGKTSSRETCLDCNDPISQERRDAVPGVQRCVQCQKSREVHYAT